MQAVKLSDKVWWVGAIDWEIRNFHGYATNRGTTYNAFLVLADKITLIDTVKASFKDEMMSRIESLVSPGKIDYIISNHSEMDHSGCLPEAIEIIKPEKVYASTNGVMALKEHFGLENITAVADGETLSLGNMNVTFHETRMIHWPDSMMSYLPEEEVLFSQDGFGMHLASVERFDDEIEKSILDYESAKYYANILTPFSSFIKKKIEQLKSLNLKIKYLAPDHGPVWKKDINGIIEKYHKWTEQKPGKKAVITFDTMWHSTPKLAKQIEDGIASKKVDVKVMPLSVSHRSDVSTELLDAGALIVGSPTINNQMFPTVADVLTYLKGLKFKNLIGAAFGSYGWSGEAVKLIRQTLEEMKIEIIGNEINAKYVPNGEDLKKSFALGQLIGDKLTEITK